MPRFFFYCSSPTIPKRESLLVERTLRDGRTMATNNLTRRPSDHDRWPMCSTGCTKSSEALSAFDSLKCTRSSSQFRNPGTETFVVVLVLLLVVRLIASNLALRKAARNSRKEQPSNRSVTIDSKTARQRCRWDLGWFWALDPSLRLLTR